MNPSDGDQKTRSRGSGWAVMAIVLALAVVMAWFYWPAPDTDPSKPSNVFHAERFEKSIRAASFLENIQYEKAEQLYTELMKEFPDETAYVRNAAIAALANVKYHMDLAQDTKNDVTAIRAKLPDLFDRAARLILQYREQSPNDPIAYQLDVLRDARWISVLAAANPIISDEEQAKLFDKLKSYVERFPENAFLVTQFNNAAEVMSAVDPKALDATIPPLRIVQKAQPRNIYLLCLLIQRLVQAKDASALELVDPLAELLKPFEWRWKMERRPKDLSDLRRATEVGKSDLDAALGILIGWVGEAKFTEGSKADAKSIDISELAFIDLSDVVTMLGQSRSAGPSPKLPKFTLHTLDIADCRGVKWFDWNIDTQPELLCWTDRELMLGALTPERTWSPLATLPIPFALDGIAIADLFAVDAHRGATPSKTVTDPNDREAQITASMRHETIRDLILYGASGIRLVQFTPPLENATQWEILQEEIGLSDLKNVRAVIPIDWESDGDLDLAILADGKVELRENMGNRRFRSVNESSLLPDSDFRGTSIAAVDYDRDVDLDLLVAHERGFGVLENIQHGQFRYAELKEGWESLAGAQSLAFADFDNAHSWDWVGAHPVANVESGIALVATRYQPGRTVPVSLHRTLGKSGGSIATCDWNNDAKVDIVQLGSEGLQVWLNAGDFQLVPHLLLAPASTQAPYPPIALADLDRNGGLDIATVVEGKPALIINDPTSDDHFLEYRVKGISDENGGGRNNQYAVGSTVEVWGPFGYQARVIQDDAVHFGLGADSAYSLRLIFVNGLTQGLISPKNNSILEEKQVLIGSCPFLYGWDGQRWQLITDLLWNAPLGLQVAKGKVLPDRKWEYLLVPGRWMQPFHDAYELRITEELWETAYFDHVRLMSVEHPEEVEVHSNEKVGPPSIAEPKLWIFEQTTAPKLVIDAHGRDWTQAATEQDGEYAIPFQKTKKQGLVETSWLELDFGSIDPTRPAQLILTGWIYPTDTSLNIGIDQNPLLDPPSPPLLQTIQSDGSFGTTIPFTGFPGGKPKTIVVPLDFAFATDDHRIRIQHSSQIFWDRVRLGYGEAIPIPTLTESSATIDHPLLKAQWLTMQSADLHTRGFSREEKRRWFEPHGYDYGHVNPGPVWPPLGGKFTRLGDVQSLLRSNDDALVVMAPGDEMSLRFTPPAQPTSKGWVRDFVVHSTGWDKDAALNTLEGQSSLPLPSAHYLQYPPGSDDRQELLRIEQLHRETLTREPSADLFWRPSR